MNRRKLISIFLFSIAILGAQIVWTRIFSFIIWYHFAFLVISISMLGFTAGGLALNVRKSLLDREPMPFLQNIALFFAAATVLTLLIIVNLPFHGGILDSIANFSLFTFLILLVCIQFFFAGMFVSFVISTEPGKVSTLYFANLLGSGCGSALSVLFLSAMIPTAAMIAFALIAAAAAILLTPPRGQKRLSPVIPLIVTAGIVMAFFFAKNPLAEPFYMKSTKNFPALKKEQIQARTSNSLAVLDLFVDHRLSGLWGISSDEYERDHPGRPAPPRMGFCIDGWALTFAYSSAGEITEEPIFDYLPASIVYSLKPIDDILIIGSGGGIDVINALRNNVKDITAVDINPAILNAGVTYLSQFNQGIFHRPGVKPVVAEGRSYLTATDQQWDLIQLSGVDTLAATQAGAFSLSENYLYTLEAFEAYLRHLKPGGLLTLTRWMFNPPRQTLRVITVVDAALKRLGIEDTSKHIMLIADKGKFFSVILTSLSPFTPEQTARVIETCARNNFRILAMPHIEFADGQENLFSTLIDMKDKTNFIADYPFDITVTTDDKPFFMEHSKWRNAWRYSDYIFDKTNGHLLLLITTLVVFVFAFIFILVPARHARTQGTSAGRSRRTLVFFACLGLAYIMIEIVLMQKLTLYLGNPSYALVVVLCAMLIFSGIGSFISGKLRGAAARRLFIICLANVGLLILYRFLLDPLLMSTLQLSIGTRIAIVLFVLAFPATLMGMPFPTAVAALGKKRQDLVVAGWVINGYCSVLASCAAMMLSISFGFHAVLLLGAAMYAVAAISRVEIPEEMP